MKKKLTLIAALLIVLLVLEVVFCWFFFVRGRGQQDSWQEYYDLGIRYLSEGKYEEAVLCFQTAIEIDPRQAAAYRGAAQAYIASGDTDAAIHILQQGAAATGDEDLKEKLEDLTQQQEVPATEPQTEAGTQPVETQQPEAPQEGIVVSDAYSDAVVFDAFNATMTSCYHIPQFNLQGNRAESVNEEIYDELYEILEESVYQSKEMYGYADVSSMAYSWGEKDGMISTVIKTERTTFHWWDYYVYTVSAETGELVTIQELLDAYGMTEAEFYDLVRIKLEEAFVDYYGAGAGGGPELYGEYYDTQLARTVADENVQKAIAYIDSSGALCVVADVYSMAGADCYPQLIRIIGSGIVAEPVCRADHT